MPEYNSAAKGENYFTLKSNLTALNSFNRSVIVQINLLNVQKGNILVRLQQGRISPAFWSVAIKSGNSEFLTKLCRLF